MEKSCIDFWCMKGALLDVFHLLFNSCFRFFSVQFVNKPVQDDRVISGKGFICF